MIIKCFSLNIYLFDKLYNTIQYNTLQYNKYNTIQYNTIQRVYKLGSGKKPVGLIQTRFPSMFSVLSKELIFIYRLNYTCSLNADNACIFRLVYIAFDVRDEMESKYPSIVI